MANVMRKTGLILILYFTNPISAVEPSMMPEGLENIYLEMPLTEFLRARKELKSGYSLKDCLNDGFMGTYACGNANNPKRIEFSATTNHRFREKYDFLLWNTIYYDSFVSSEKTKVLDRIEILGGGISLCDVKDYPQKRDKSISYLLQKWGKPDRIMVDNKGGYYYSVMLLWMTTDVFRYAEIPIDPSAYIKTFSTLDRLWRYVFPSERERPLVKMVLTHRRNPILPKHVPGKAMTGIEDDLPAMPPDCRGEQIVRKKVAVEILKRAGLYERLID